MKNDLTRDEWLVLAEFIKFGHGVYLEWELDNCLNEKLALLETAKEKVILVSSGLKKKG